MDVPLKNIYTFEALSSKSIKLQTEDDSAADTCLVLPHLPIEDDITSDCESEIVLNDDVSSQPNLSMRTNEQINDLRTMKIDEEMGFHPGHGMSDTADIKKQGKPKWVKPGEVLQLGGSSSSSREDKSQDEPSTWAEEVKVLVQESGKTFRKAGTFATLVRAF
ncbi:uncharacterized protein LOC142334037 [Lycorma delicatula]|uniref:uncharacterized protein LOC142334037 n=1 Tax=Lycorma delicatula TaxID=130591 RepID=UPI003F50D66D